MQTTRLHRSICTDRAIVLVTPRNQLFLTTREQRPFILYGHTYIDDKENRKPDDNRDSSDFQPVDNINNNRPKTLEL